MLKILAIGNSFSEDATYFLHDILEDADVENRVVNLYIGGCSLERHWQNIERDLREYQYQLNGRKTDRFVTIDEILKEENFDVIVTQQASHDSGWSFTYEPFLGLMLEYLGKNTKSGIILNETWAYDEGSDHPNFMRYDRDQKKMFEALKAAYEGAAQRHNLSLIHSGELVQRIRELPEYASGKKRITRDGYHMDFLYGRFAVALLWAKEIAGIDPEESDFTPEIDFMPDIFVDPELIIKLRRLVADIQ